MKLYSIVLCGDLRRSWILNLVNTYVL
jgi:hypothetical protein